MVWLSKDIIDYEVMKQLCKHSLMTSIEHVRICSRFMCSILWFSRSQSVLSDDDIQLQGLTTSWQIRLSYPLCQIECSAAQTGARTWHRRGHP